MLRSRRLTMGCAGIATGLVALSLSGSVHARKAPEGPPPAQVTSILNCRAIADSARRLACYDQAVQALGQAVERRDVVVFDREGVRKTKRGLFGFGIPNLGIFGDEDNEVEVKQIEAAITGLGRTMDGWTFRLDDGSRWVQTDGKMIVNEPRVGDKVVVKKAALSSYILSVGKQPGVKVKRTN